jgi:sugar (pentulose or hexulose) kinase
MLGIDIGTSFIKGTILDLDKRQFSHVERLPFPDPLPGLPPQFCEYDPGQIKNAIWGMVCRLDEIAGGSDGLVICTQMSSMVLMDADGRTRSNCIGWRDQRALMQHPSGAGLYFDVYKQRIDARQLALLGNEVHPGMPGSFLFWMAEQGKPEPGLIPLSLGDFVLRTLCGSSAGVEYTNAMSYGLLNLHTMQWHEEVIHQLGLDIFVWPPLVEQGSIVGCIDLGGKKVPCYTPVGDYQCALAGVLLGKDNLSINISTGSQVSRLTPKLQLGAYQSRPFFDGQFTNTISHLPAGRSLNVLVSLLTEIANRSGANVADPWRWIAEAVRSTESSDLKVDLGFFPGPSGDHGGISAINEKNLTVGTLFLAAFVNMADNYWSAASRIWPNRSWKRIILSGGLANKLPSLYKVIEKRFGTALQLCPYPEETLCGLLVLAMAFSGQCETVTDAMSDLRSRVAETLEVQTN